MSIYQKILVALDGSEESFNALRYAINFGKKLKAEILALTVVQLKGEVSSALSLFLGMEDLFKKGAESILKKAEAIASELGADISTLVRKGDPASEVIDCALTEGCELIVSPFPQSSIFCPSLKLNQLPLGMRSHILLRL